MNKVIAGIDPVLMDAYACKLMGHGVGEVPYIGLAEKYGAGSADLSKARVIELGDVEKSIAAPCFANRYFLLLCVNGNERACPTRRPRGDCLLGSVFGD